MALFVNFSAMHHSSLDIFLGMDGRTDPYSWFIVRRVHINCFSIHRFSSAFRSFIHLLCKSYIHFNSFSIFPVSVPSLGYWIFRFFFISNTNKKIFISKPPLFVVRPLSSNTVRPNDCHWNCLVRLSVGRLLRS